MSIYTDIYNTIAQYVFGNNMNAVAELFTIFASLTSCAVVITLPFTIVFLIIKLMRG